MDYKEKAALGWDMANFLHNNEEFKTELADNIFFDMKVGREITNLQQTVSDMLGKLITETKKNDTEENYTQLVVQLNPDINHGKEWKMFVYYNQDNDTFTYSYQDQNYWDSDFYPSNTREFMLAKVLEEAKAVGGIQWIELDF